MLSCLPHRPLDSNDDKELTGPNKTGKMFEVSMINSSNIIPRTFTQITDNKCTKEDLNLPGYDLRTDQTNDKELLKLKEELQSGKASKAFKSKCILLNTVLYYLSKADSDPVIWLYIPKHQRKEAIEQHHDNNGHMGIDMTHDAIKIKYYWSNMYKNLYQYITSCITCQTRNQRKVKPPQQGTDTPPYPFIKLGVDASGPYHKTFR